MRTSTQMPPNVLIVDNDADQAGRVKDTLLVDGLDVDWVGRREEAVARIRTRHIDVVLLDLMLVRGSFGPAIEVLEAIRATEPSRRCLVFTYSNYGPDLVRDTETMARLEVYAEIAAMETLDVAKLLRDSPEARNIKAVLRGLASAVERRGLAARAAESTRMQTGNRWRPVVMLAIVLAVFIGGLLFVPGRLVGIGTSCQPCSDWPCIAAACGPAVLVAGVLFHAEILALASVVVRRR